ncbi:isopentenyl-diphosphate delta-isomerase [Crossiella equi]|uniref:Isopentenyl-diphosphate Delta-isomerase n=1 Tax=Crossiella equi TaxID=130796 RepID=A0ABS5A8C8_9PSEU|nr:isopentenyl-diphosphate Delta-isomerase [Crossiella equi]MBP2472835.1 isopentenyl-diphosphate delta-isomerase [Crossiella equi]
MAVQRRIVELVDPDGTTIGETSVEEAHTPPGRLHRAFSVMLFDGDDRVLLQQRAFTKNRFPGLWANTCCSHPLAGEDIALSAIKRVEEELHLRIDELREVGTFTYQALDGHGAAEHEFDHVLIGRTAADADRTARPEAEEIEQLQWVPYTELVTDHAAHPERYAPWVPGVVELIEAARATR